MATSTIRVSGVSCGHCTGTIERELGDLDGVTSVVATREGEVTVEHDDRVAPRATLESLLREINYPPVESAAGS